ncbi:MAG: chemotaxis protein CheW [Bdellovibrionota bacterium]
MANQVDLKEFVTGFVLEADEHLHSVNQNLVSVAEALRQGKPEPRAIRELFRSLHTIKGLASMVGAQPIVDVSHEMESILRTADRSGGRLPEKFLDLLLRGTRAIEERVQAITKVGVSGIPKVSPQLIEALILSQEQFTELTMAPEAEITAAPEIVKLLTSSDKEQILEALRSGKRALLIEYHPSPEKTARGLNISAVRDRLGKFGELVKVMPHSSPKSPTGISFRLLLVTTVTDKEIIDSIETSDEFITSLGYTQKEASVADTLTDEDELDFTPLDHSSIRVDIKKLDETLERLSELVITRSKLAKVAADLRDAGADTRALNAVIAENGRQLKRLRTAITEARMVPLAELLQRLPLIVRGITKDTSKSVAVLVKAGSAEVDKAVADKIMPAIVHLVRNAVDHAIETKEERKKNNKPEGGTVLVQCDDTSGTHLLLTISDDGRGIDREAVAKKAGKRVAQSQDELLQQITTPGLSTREEVTTTSGRGMGMDIVKRTIEILGGSMTVNTTPGSGTSFTLKVPVSVTIVDVMSFVSGGQTYVAPVAVIEEIIEVDFAKLKTSPVPSNRGPQPALLERRGEAIPLLNLDSILKIKESEIRPHKALIVKLNQGIVAFGVDKMLGRQEVVVRPLDDTLVRSQGMAGATDMGDGKPTLVLDLSTLGAAILRESAGTI